MRSSTLLLLPALLGGVIAAALIVVPSSALADTTPSKSDAQALYNKLAAVFKKKDIKPLEALTAPNVVYKTADGKTVTRDEWIESWGTELKTYITVETATFTVSRVKMAGENLIVDASWHLACTITDPVGNPHKLDVTSLEQDTWTKVKGKWLLLIQKDIPGAKRLLDGKPRPFRKSSNTSDTRG